MGAHGSGKTTLLLELARQLRAAGHSVTELFTNDDAGRSLPKQWAVADSDAIVLADGYDSLNAVGRFRMRRMYSRLIVTSHETCSLPTLHVCEARDEVLRWVVRELTGHAMEQRTAERLLNAHHRNMREAIRALYDLATEDSMLFSAAGNAERVRE
jgi:hypothetical protein